VNSSPANNSSNFFSWKGIVLQQDERVLKVGTDALLLATWLPTLIKNPKNILDVGTGSGILALLMAQSFEDSFIVAIDPDEHAVQLARINTGKSNFKNRIRVDQTGLFEYETSTDQKFDLIISNPPFYVNHILPAQGAMQTAKHAASSPADWMSALTHLVDKQAYLCLVLPTMVTFEWIREANNNQLFCNSRMDFFSFPEDKQAKRSLLCFNHVLDTPNLSRMVMYKSKKNYTMEYATWLGI